MNPLSYREVIKKARKAGFVFRRNTGGTHEIWWNEETRRTCVIPRHKEIKIGTLKSIINQMGIKEKEFKNYSKYILKLSLGNVNKRSCAAHYLRQFSVPLFYSFKLQKF